MFRRPPKYHHYWPKITHMPPLKHSLVGRSELMEWLKKTFDIDDALAAAVFSSAKQAKYIIQHDGRWIGDAIGGYRYWKNGGKSGEKRTTKKLPSTTDLLEALVNPEFCRLYNKCALQEERTGKPLSLDEIQEVCNGMWEGDPIRSVKQKQAMRIFHLYLKAKAREEEEAKGQP